MKKSIFIFAGEVSGDLHGEKVVQQMRREFPRARIFGVGGPKMRTAGLECVLPMEQFQVMGFIDVFFALPRLMKHFFFLKKILLKEQPELVLLIDYPGFNLALAKSLRKNQFKGKICHYICPSVWAWGKKRIPKMEKIYDHLYVIFPFEQKFFNQEKLPVRYVGHPLVKEAKNNNASPIDIDSRYRVGAIFPGSRLKEIHRNFPIQLKIANKLLKKHDDLFFVISVAQAAFSRPLDEIMRNQGITNRDRFMFVDSSLTPNLLKRAEFAIAKSGTNNLELALHHIPTVVTYGIGTLDLFIAKNLLKINLPHYSITNIVANERVFPELIGPQLTEEALFTHADQLLSSEKSFQDCREKCQGIGKILQDKTPEQEIVQAIKDLLDDKQTI